MQITEYIMLCFMQSMQCMAWMEMDISDTRTLLQNLMRFIDERYAI